MHTQQYFNLACLLAFALFANIPLGYLRQGSDRYSIRWFIYIHLSIPFIVALRYHYGFDWIYIPLTIAFAVLGQFIGGRLQRRSTSS